jgi:hypothetical protein
MTPFPRVSNKTGSPFQRIFQGPSTRGSEYETNHREMLFRCC